MFPRELVLNTSGDTITTLTFTDSLLTIHFEPRKPNTLGSHPFFFYWSPKHSHSEVPLHNVIAATVSDSQFEVSYLERSGKHPFQMKQVRADLQDKDISLATEWCDVITQVAYKGANPSKSLKVLINPYGGPGKARQIFAQKVEPILRAAGCTLDVTLTTRAGHAIEIAQNMELTYDALVVVSGDGLIHEVLNGLAKHATPEKAFAIPVAPIPAGSGNALSLNILGLHEGLDPCAAALNILKGRPIKVDLFSFTQGNHEHISFMSQAIGIMADLDIETEHLRWVGDFRFILGFLRGVVTRKICQMELSMKVVEQDKSQMVDALYSRRKSATKGVPPVSDITPSDNKPDEDDSPGSWVTFDKPILWMVAGKGPYVSRSLMQFPVSHPDDGLIDISIQEIVSRRSMLEAMEGAELGRPYWLSSNRYFKASAYRAKPLTTRGVLSVDGESFPFEEFQVEVLHRLGTLLSPNPYYAADFNVIDDKGTTREIPWPRSCP